MGKSCNCKERFKQRILEMIEDEIEKVMNECEDGKLGDTLETAHGMERIRDKVKEMEV